VEKGSAEAGVGRCIYNAVHLSNVFMYVIKHFSAVLPYIQPAIPLSV
jgi:hypothetical protein